MASEFENFLKDQFAPMEGVVFRRMFGGTGIFRQKTMFGLVDDDTLYFRVDDQTVPEFEAEGCGPFIYRRKDGKQSSMPYWRAPERLFDEPEEFVVWAEKAFEASAKS